MRVERDKRKVTIGEWGLYVMWLELGHVVFRTKL